MCIRDSFSNATLWTNFTGDWAANNTNASAITNNSVNTITVNGISEGQFVWNVLVCDNETTPLCSFAVANYSLGIDTTPPNVRIDAPANYSNFSGGNDVTINVTCDDSSSGASWVYTNDSHWNMDGSPPFNVTNNTALTGGAHSLTVYCNDSAGNVNYSQVHFNVLPPGSITVTLNSPANNSWYSSSTIVFLYTPVSNYGLTSAVLWSNFSGVWAENNSNADPVVNNAVNSIVVENVPDGQFIWNVRVCDDEPTPLCANASENYVLNVNVSQQNNTVYIVRTQTSTVYVPKEVLVPTEVETFVPTVVPEHVSINIIEKPEVIEIYPDDLKTVQIKLRNPEASALEGINLSVETNAPGVTTTLETPVIESLAPSEEKTVNVVFQSQGAAEGSYDVPIKAWISSANVWDSTTALLRVMKYLSADKRAAQEAINFTRQFLAENPECAELRNDLDTAQKQLDADDVGGATDRVKKIIEACKNTLNLLGEEKTQSITGLVAANVISMVGGIENVASIGAGMALALTMLFLHNIYRRIRTRKKTSEGPAAKHVKERKNVF